MDRTYRVVYQGRLRRGQTRSGVASRLSEALGRDRALLEEILDGPAQTLLATASETEARRLAAIFTEAGAEMAVEGPGDQNEPAADTPSTAASADLKPSVPPSFSQRIWLVRAAAVLLVIALVAGLAFSLLVAGLVALLLSYSWTLDLLPWPAIVLPVYVTVALVLLLISAGLIKPFVRFGPHLPCDIQLKRANEPVLFEFIDLVCQVIRVPQPKAVFVDMSASVTAGVQPGAPLTIGLAVVASVTTADLGGLVARALTLHARGGNGRLGRFVSSSVHRLHDAVHGRDLFDQALDRGLQSGNPLVSLLARELSTLLRISRRILGYVLKEAIGTSAAAMQSIEWHGDRHQAWIIGSERFSSSVRLMRLVRFAADRSESALRDAWQKGRPLPAELPLTLVARLKSLAREASLAKVIAIAEREQEIIPAFHVADGKRIERILNGGFEPAVTCVTAARDMVRGFSLLSRRLTMLYYRNRLHLPVTPLHLQPRVDADRNVLDAFCGPACCDMIIVAPGGFLDRAKTTSELVAHARKLAEVLPAARDKAKKSLERYKDVENLLLQSLFEELVLRTARSTRRMRTKLEAVQTRCRALEEGLENTYSALMPYGELISRRLANGIALLERPETAARLSSASVLAARAAGLSDVLDKLQQQMGVLREMSIHVFALEMLMTCDANDANSALKDRIAEQEAEIGSRLTAVRVALKRLQNPLQENTTVFEYVQADWVPTSSEYAVLDETSVVLDGLLRLRSRIIARLALLTKAADDAWAGQAEKAV